MFDILPPELVICNRKLTTEVYKMSYSKEQLRSMLQDRKLNIVADHAEVDYRKLCRFANGETENLAYEMGKKLELYFDGPIANCSKEG